MMRLSIPSGWSLKRTALTLLIPAMTFLGAFELWSTYRTAVDVANSAYDRSLLGAMKAIDANISTASGGVAVELPYTMLEFFQLTASGEVYFRVGTEDGLIEIGSADLPQAPQPQKTGVPGFYDAVYFGERMRVVSYARELDRGGRSQLASHGRIVIQVAETLSSRSEFIRTLLLQAARRDLLLLAATGGMLALVLHLTLKPLAQLRDDVGARSSIDLTPIGTASVPADLRPLVDAINLHMARTQQVLDGRRRFVDDASHQLRTPLATLRTQLDYVLRETDPSNVKQALLAISRQINQATRRTNQMLALAAADAAGAPVSEVSLAHLARQAAREVVLAAREKKIDLELDNAKEPLFVPGHSDLLREATLNLLHNAIRFAPEGGHVKLKLSRTGDLAAITVSDDGPGIPEDELPRVGQRFYRASNASAGGSGLGLAIARAVVERHGGQLIIANASDRRGCDATLLIPVSASGVAA